jgi:hypothetical protein
LYHQFAQKIAAQPNVNLVTVEMAFGGRDHTLSSAPGKHIQVRGHNELWHKENLLNIGIQSLPHDWKYVAWLDADIAFARPDWAIETIHQLQHYHVVQMFSHAVDLGPNHEFQNVHKSFMFCYAHGIGDIPQRYGSIWHSGFAWAMRREAYDAVGGLIDTAILGAADRNIATALVGNVGISLPPGLTAGYRRPIERWQELAEQHIKRNVGYVPGTVIHDWHGKKADRKYKDRWQILIRNQFNPDTDLVRNYQGVMHLAGNKQQLRDDLRNYFRSRNEDSIDVS